MIHPCLATMLVVVTTDYPLAAGDVDAFLRPAVETSFNCISVDGDCSTNDAVVLLANGAGDAVRSPAADEAFRGRAGSVCASLARQVVEDGEGATVRARDHVDTASSQEEAVAIARRIATSPLVKTAAFGHDPNWGRVLMAAGSAPYNGGFARSRHGTPHRRLRRRARVRGRRADRATCRSSQGRVPHRARARSRRRRGLVSRLRPVLRLRPHQRGVHDMSSCAPCRRNSAGASRFRRPQRVHALRAEGHEVVVVHGAGPQITAEMRGSQLPRRSSMAAA